MTESIHIFIVSSPELASVIVGAIALAGLLVLAGMLAENVRVGRLVARTERRMEAARLTYQMDETATFEDAITQAMRVIK